MAGQRRRPARRPRGKVARAAARRAWCGAWWSAASARPSAQVSWLVSAAESQVSASSREAAGAPAAARRWSASPSSSVQSSRAAAASGQSAWDIAAHYTALFEADLRLLNIRPLEHPRATDHVAGMIVWAAAMEAAGIRVSPSPARLGSTLVELLRG